MTGTDRKGPGPSPRGRRLPAATRLGPVRLQVADVRRSVDYYERVLGLRELDGAVQPPEDAARATDVVLGPHGDDLPLVVLHERPGATPVPRGGQLGLFHFAVLVPDRPSLGRFLAHLQALGVPASTGDHAVSEAIYLRDPDGLGIEVYVDRPRETWRYVDGELFMKTEPVGIAGLVRAGGDATWNGMPRGTVMGHVHLSVGDLGEAAAFYHSALGFDKTVWNFPGALFMSAGGYHHHLGTNVWARGATRPGPNDAQLLEWELVVPSDADVYDVATRMVQNGYTVETAGRQALVADPWRIRLRIDSSQP